MVVKRDTTGLITEGTEAEVTYTTVKGTVKTITGEVLEASTGHAYVYALRLLITEDGEEKERKVTVSKTSSTVHTKDRSSGTDWRRIGKGAPADVEVDLKLGGWVQRGDSEYRWHNPDTGDELYIVSPVDRRGYQFVYNDEVLDTDPVQSREEAVSTAEALMDFNL